MNHHEKCMVAEYLRGCRYAGRGAREVRFEFHDQVTVHVDEPTPCRYLAGFGEQLLEAAKQWRTQTAHSSPSASGNQPGKNSARPCA